MIILDVTVSVLLSYLWLDLVLSEERHKLLMLMALLVRVLLLQYLHIK